MCLKSFHEAENSNSEIIHRCCFKPLNWLIVFCSKKIAKTGGVGGRGRVMKPRKKHEGKNYLIPNVLILK